MAKYVYALFDRADHYGLLGLFDTEDEIYKILEEKYAQHVAKFGTKFHKNLGDYILVNFYIHQVKINDAHVLDDCAKELDDDLTEWGNFK